ncbi:DUF5908 family protein [Fulvivirga maritima]|uniref:DUF5908 family protein n=1 Tax=Fulvivirga maritima TaxID=2904247 RepID=UPI001F17D3BC|nr:DUF5908 family protein [Fulvivirga maritima]UII27384.1 DUF5908 family protein [Fulvivirga maritima]
MPLKINEFVIQAKFEEGAGSAPASRSKAVPLDIELLKEDIIKECLDKMEDYLIRKERR